jgi:uncharacterized MnhB-related membrane protein
MNSLLRIILILFLFKFLYNLSTLLVNFSFNMVYFHGKPLNHIICLAVTGFLAFLTYKMILRKKQSKEL